MRLQTAISALIYTPTCLQQVVREHHERRFDLETPRDRAGSFEPQLIKKHQTSVSDEIEAKILSMYGLGMSYRDIATQVEDLYGIKVSTATLTAITDKIIAQVREWQQRPLESLYPFVWLEAIRYKVKDNGRYKSKAVYTILAVNLEGKRKFSASICPRVRAPTSGYLS